MIPDENDRAEQCKAGRRKDPIRELPPVKGLHSMKGIRIQKLPRAKDIDFVRPIEPML